MTELLLFRKKRAQLKSKENQKCHKKRLGEKFRLSTTNFKEASFARFDKIHSVIPFEKEKAELLTFI